MDEGNGQVAGVAWELAWITPAQAQELLAFWKQDDPQGCGWYLAKTIMGASPAVRRASRKAV
jgi:hypothetical protein